MREFLEIQFVIMIGVVIGVAATLVAQRLTSRKRQTHSDQLEQRLGELFTVAGERLELLESRVRFTEDLLDGRSNSSGANAKIIRRAADPP